MKKRQKRLSGFFIKKFILFSFVLVFCFSLFFNVMVAMSSSGAKVLSVLSADQLIQPDYESIDTSLLENLDGWIEILDEQNNVIFRKGQVGEFKESYTQTELLEQASFSASKPKKSFTIAGVIKISSIDETKIKPYIASYHTFIGDNGQSYTGIVKLPADRLDVSYTIVNATGELGYLTMQNALMLLLGTLGILGVCIFYYSKNIEKHLAKPNKALVEGMEEVTLGNYETKLNFEAEYEYKEIQSSFNYLTERLKEAKEQREQFEKEKEQLFSNLAHDLKTPITTIQGYAQVLNDEMVSEESKRKEYLSTIYHKSQHLTELINRLLAYTKLNHTNYHLTLKEVDYCEFLRQIIVDCIDEVEQYEDELIIEIPDEPILISIDEIEMERVIINLIYNALKHNPPKTCITISVTQTKTHLILKLADNGVKIPSTLQKQLFEPFVCGDESRTSKQGSGLGLSICQKIIQKHNGVIEFHQNDQHKYFEIRLPKQS